MCDMGVMAIRDLLIWLEDCCNARRGVSVQGGMRVSGVKDE